MNFASWYTGSKRLIRPGAIYKGNSEADSYSTKDGLNSTLSESMSSFSDTQCPGNETWSRLVSAPLRDT